ncbi:MAG: MarR family transcriptional regulator [Rhodobacteraceae bacterium]|nr:MarR family transcriptional regulator [Alphaproteobacteria bacterium]MBT8473913.1 MarR family transcriptional regulator [Alphaproteobacteria bacterium]NNF73275.1 MarR family transcriptional regulator [Paracoccaceae bacterium]NNK67999.1 MarR family transcriptional regulator [Paracoccaceae bacterium]
MPDRTLETFFAFFTEIGIIEQLSRALLEARLPHGFLVSHFSVLNHLIRVQDGQTPLVLARAFQVPKTTMTHTLAVLEKHGLVEMRPNPDDKRSKRVWITATGRAFRDDAIAELLPDIERLRHRIDPAHLAQMTPGLEEVRVALDRDRDDPAR